MSRAKLVAKIGAGATALAVPLVMLYEGTVLQSYRVHRFDLGAGAGAKTMQEVVDGDTK